ncbi:glycine cleavage T C-terminal barrel domain-containing protein [Variovorax sp. GB1P17]|uniref:glycine cleavage T C-terminal barrel domain-containing protein n=1 Tax=Variovorax sp. GB1P17 TaxID=3443740 RepID=UPI003F46F48E
MFAPPDSHRLPHATAVPVRNETVNYTRFGASFEPSEYTNWVDESMSWKTTCYIGDWSPLGKLIVKGPDALRFFSDIAINSFAKFEVGQAKHAVFCNEDGKVMGEGVLMKLAEQEYMFTSGPGVLWAQYMFEKGAYDASFGSEGPDRFILQVQGPNAIAVMEAVTGESLRDIGFMRFRPTSIEGMSLLALRQGMSGEVGYELHGRMEDAVQIYQAILDVGAAYGIKRLGGRVKMVNHVEACFPTPTVDYIPALFGEREKGFHDFLCAKAPSIFNIIRPLGSCWTGDISAYYRSPAELGWGKSIKFDHGFVGREALARELELGHRRMVTLVWNDDDVVDVYASLFRQGTPHDYMELPRGLLGGMESDRVEHQGRLVGATTSRCYSYHFRKMISLCTVDPELSDPGTEVSIIYGGAGGAPKTIRATVAPAPFKTDKRKVDLTSLAGTVPAAR